ncbi:hypothetical protein J6590_034941 [Homalodisca vitripennis]|nr:hypothetical protein J6590_034941 [Homalodisca vitripennis]
MVYSLYARVEQKQLLPQINTRIEDNRAVGMLCLTSPLCCDTEAFTFTSCEINATSKAHNERSEPCHKHKQRQIPNRPTKIYPGSNSSRDRTKRWDSVEPYGSHECVTVPPSHKTHRKSVLFLPKKEPDSRCPSHTHIDPPRWAAHMRHCSGISARARGSPPPCK